MADNSGKQQQNKSGENNSSQWYKEINRTRFRLSLETARANLVVSNMLLAHNALRPSQQSINKATLDSVEKDQQLQQLEKKIVIAHKLAVEKGKFAANQFKLVMLGAEGAGKTSTVNSLIGRDFQPGQPPTIGADVSNTCTVDRHCVTDWKLNEFSHHLESISIHYKHELQQVMTEPLQCDVKPTQEGLNAEILDVLQNLMVKSE